MSDDSGDVVLITGGNGTIGSAIARRLADARDREIVLLGRNDERLNEARDDIVDATDHEAIRTVVTDVSRRDEVYELADRWEGPLDVLINNASATPRERRETPEGLEVQFATNVLGYFWMIRAFREILAESAPSRIVNVASYWAGGLELDDLQFERRRYDNDAAYRQSKQAERMLTRACAERLADRNISVNACHPGDTPSKLARNLGFGGHQSPDEAADTPAWLATSATGLDKTGCYFRDRSERTCQYMQDRDAVEAFWERCLAYD